MARHDQELFDRLRAAGLRKQIARPLSAVGADARKRSVKAARAAIDELRALADELERRLPAEPPSASAAAAPSASGSASGPASGSAAGSAAAENRAAIVQALGGGPLTASELAAKTGISVSAAGSTARRMVNAGELVKATRGYALPS